MDITASLIKVADRQMDMLIRASILEAAAGLPKGTWSRNPMRGLAEAAGSYPALNDEWLTTADLGFYEAMIAKANQKVHNIEVAREIAQDIVGGFSLKSETAMQHIGRNYADDILNIGKKTDKYKAELSRHAAQRAMDHIRRKQNIAPSLTNPDDGGEMDIPAALSDRVDALDSLLSGEAGRQVTEWLERVWKAKGRPADQAIAFKWLEAVRRNPNVKNRDIAREIGVSEQMVSAALSRMKAIAINAMKSDERFIDMLERYTDLEQLGYGNAFRVAKELVPRRIRVLHRLLQAMSS